MTSKKSKNFPKSWPKKAAQKDIRTNLLKENVDVFGKKHEMTSVIPFILQNFPTNWNKQTSYLHIKKSKLSKENYRPISIFPNVPKKVLVQSNSNISLNISFPDINAVFARVMTEKWRKNVNNGCVFGALWTDLSKAFGIWFSYRHIKVNNAYSLWKDIFYGVPQRSIYGPLLFNIHLCDLFYFLEGLDILSLVDDIECIW